MLSKNFSAFSLNLSKLSINQSSSSFAKGELSSKSGIQSQSESLIKLSKPSSLNFLNSEFSSQEIADFINLSYLSGI
jgi:hypothetical protein